MTEMIKCSKCGKMYELPAGALGNWIARNPDKAKCPECFAGKTTSTTKSSGGSGSFKSAKSSCTSKTTKRDVDAQLFREAYDELVEAFKDIKDEVIPYLGGWTSTIVINRSK